MLAVHTRQRHFYRNNHKLKSTENTMAKKKLKLPGVFAFQRSFNVTDAAMYNKIGDTTTPLLITEHGINATQNVSSKSKAAKEATEVGKERSVGNIQTVQSAKTDVSAEAMIVRFGFRALPLSQCLHSCNSGDNAPAMRDTVTKFLERCVESDAPMLFSERIARNIANGRWLWRNRLLATEATIVVSVSGDPLETFNAFEIPLNHFNDINDAEKAVAEVISGGLSGTDKRGLEIEATVKFGVEGSVEVYPSQNYVPSGGRGNKKDDVSRSLYKLFGGVTREPRRADGFTVVGQGAIRDAKISNALKTIDTWYPDFEETGLVISLEPNGANRSREMFYRSGDSSVFNLLPKLNDIDPESDEGLYTMGIMFRGGVVGE